MSYYDEIKDVEDDYGQRPRSDSAIMVMACATVDALRLALAAEQTKFQEYSAEMVAIVRASKDEAEKAKARLGLLIDKPHAERIKEFLSELAEYLGLDDGAKIPEDFINAASSIRQGMETQASQLATLSSECAALRALVALESKPHE